MNNLNIRALRSSLLGTATMAALLFIPAGTLDYWQAWLFMAVFVVATTAITVYLAMKDPKLLERRMRAGPTAEKEPAQKIIMFFAMTGFLALLIFPALDHRFAWSPVPTYLSFAGDALIAVGFFLVFIVLKVNTYGASTIQIAEDQVVISTGPYALVRHPMYCGALPLLIGIPLALDSWWGLFVLVLVVPAIMWRLLDEEKFLQKNLEGYADYCQKVRYHLVPFIW
ncbi:methyltransferase family protein [Caballeronia sp.]|uniref:methyltransferase family protein n=1 Tax=Caballeronia sp. TaxID=1931223 RepID=UPI003C3E3046